MTIQRFWRSSFLLAAVLFIAIFSGDAQAVVIDLSLTTEPSLGTISTVVDVNGFSGELWTSEVIGFAPTTVDQGDQINLVVHFTGSQALQLTSGDFFFGNEEIDFVIRPLPGISVAGTSTLDALFGVGGDLDLALPFVQGFTTGGQLAGTATTDFTDTAFSFQGFSLATTYTLLTGGPVNVSSLELVAAADQVRIVQVPEPSMLALFVVALAAVGRRSNARKLPGSAGRRR
jgi:hypothetical protein